MSASLNDVRLRSKTGENDNYRPPARRQFRGVLPKRAALTAFFLLIVGVIFGIIGVYTTLTNGVSEAVPFLTLGFIGFIPGVYHVVIIARTYLGHEGYTYDLVPSYD